MDAESFFARWSRRKTEAKQEEQQESRPADAQPPAAQPEPPPPTLQAVDKLTYSDDFSPYFAKQVDEIIRRAAMKKLFADPRFNIMDGLDVYIEDYNKFEPLTPETLAELNHADALLNPIMEPKHKLMELLELEPSPEQQEPPAATSMPSDTSAENNTGDTPPSQDTPPHDDNV